MKTIIFDIDGTLADLGHRLHHVQGGKKDWAAFFDAMADDIPTTEQIQPISVSHHGYC